MGKFWIEVCLISARGLQRSSLWKLQWFAVGWINPKNQYCTKIDASGSADPVWKTKFATLIDVSDEELEKLALHVEVHSREPIFLRERIHGTATILLQEYLAKHAKKSLAKHAKKSETKRLGAEVGSYQLRKGNSNKPKGFVDVSIRISEEEDEPSPSPGDDGIIVINHVSRVTLVNDDASSQTYSKQPVVPQSRENQFMASDDASSQTYPKQQVVPRSRENQFMASDDASSQTYPKQPVIPRIRENQFMASDDASSQTYPKQLVVPRSRENQFMASDDASPKTYPTRPAIILRSRENQSDTALSQSHIARNHANFSKPLVNASSYSPAAGPGIHQPQTRTPTPPPPPPPTNVGYIPTFIPRTENYPGTYITPPPATLESRRGPGFGMGLGAGALAAGAVIFGDDFLSVFDASSGLQDASLTISTNPSF